MATAAQTIATRENEKPSSGSRTRERDLRTTDTAMT
jgi:hypothetical protein